MAGACQVRTSLLQKVGHLICDAGYSELSEPRTRPHDEFRLSAFETRASEPTTTPPHLVGIEFTAHVGHLCKISHRSSEDSIMRDDGERNKKPLPIGQRLLLNIYIKIGIC